MNRYLGQAVAYAIFILVIGLLSAWPPYRILAEQQAMVSLTFSHAAKRVGECRLLTQEELNELPPNMRRPKDCPRERHPIRVELRANGQSLFVRSMAPSGLWNDGKANVYHRIPLEAGKYHFLAAMNESGGADSFDYERSEDVVLVPGQNLVISFDELTQSFVFE